MARVERLQPTETSRLRALRLRSLLDAPDAYGSTHAQDVGTGEARWQEVAAYPWWIAVDDERDLGDVGLVSGGQHHGDVATRWVYAMWVDPLPRDRSISLTELVLDLDAVGQAASRRRV